MILLKKNALYFVSLKERKRQVMSDSCDFHEEAYVRFGNRDYLWYPDFSQNHLGKREAHPEGCS